MTKETRKTIAVIILIAGLIVGIYVAFWLCFIGGIIGLIKACKATPISGGAIAWNVVKIIFAWPAGKFVLLVCAGIAKLVKK